MKGENKMISTIITTMLLLALMGNIQTQTAVDVTRTDSCIIEVARTEYDALASYEYEPIAPCGSYGALKIYGTSINLTLDLIDSPEDFAYAQGICDDPNRGVVQDYSFNYGYAVTPLIADHKHQGFNQIYDLVPGTVCEVYFPDGTSQQYVLRDKTREGVNNEVNILAYGRPAETVYPSDWLCMYTCNPEGWWTVTVTFWEPLR